MRYLLLLALAFVIASCQFTETMVINEDGSGKLSLEMDMSEMMGTIGGGMLLDSTMTRMDTIVRMKDFLKEYKDSIATLSVSDQQKLERMEDYQFRMLIDDEQSTMLLDVFTDFKDVSELENLMNGLNTGSQFMPGVKNESEMEEDDSPELIGIKYSFKKGKFTRDAFILDKELHKQQIDSMKSAESFMTSMIYTLKYTFPKKIVTSSIEDASYSFDRKTIEIERSFLDYMKNPDVLDLEIEIEN